MNSSVFALQARLAFTAGSMAVVLIIALDSINLNAATLHVWQDSPSPGPPYADWATAAHVIQEAVDAAADGDTVLVADGVYAAGGRPVVGTMTNRVVIHRAITLQSLNGPEVTMIVGAAAQAGALGNEAIRCVYMDRGVLSGFTLTNGHAGASEAGGGVRGAGEFGDSLVTNCIITGNSAGNGGGASGSHLRNCTILENHAQSAGGAFASFVDGCVLASNRASVGGAAIWCVLSNCTIQGNSAELVGGGAGQSQLWTCSVWGNSAGQAGGGVGGGALHNCTVVYNTASQVGGGVASCSNFNSIVYDNKAEAGIFDNYHESTFFYSCTSPLPPEGIGNLAEAPQLASLTHLAASSPCVAAGHVDFADGVDLDGDPWAEPPSMGSDQFVVGGASGLLTVAVETEYNHFCTGFATTLKGWIHGQASTHQWDFGDGTVRSNHLRVTHSWGEPGLYEVRLSAFNASHPEGVSTSLTVRVEPRPIYYVNKANPTPVFPYTNWTTAATQIQEAIGAGWLPGRLVLVTNGVYDRGGTTLPGEGLTNRVVLTNAVHVQSVNGPLSTFIRGRGPVGSNAIRCAYLGERSMLSGFRLWNGHTWAETFDFGGGFYGAASAVVSNCHFRENSAPWGGSAAYGGTLLDCSLTDNTGANTVVYSILTNSALSRNQGRGAYGSILHQCLVSENRASEDGAGVSESYVTDSILAGNTTSGSGGGAIESTLINCLLVTNHAQFTAGGAHQCELIDCTLATNTALMQPGGAGFGTLRNCSLLGNRPGGALGGRLFDCLITGNWGPSEGGGVSGGALYNCVLTHNRAGMGGGAMLATLYNCLLAHNVARSQGGGAADSTLFNCLVACNTADQEGGGGRHGRFYNCIVYDNSAPNDANFSGSMLAYSCSWPLPAGLGNITNEPAFLNAAADDFRLAYGSPCIDAGTNLSALLSNDLDGHVRPLDGNGDGVAAFDMGAYEFDLRTVVPTNWFAQYGLDPTDPHVVSENPDGDAHTTFQEWMADTDPTDGRSFFRIDHIQRESSGPPATVYIQTSSNRYYTLFGADALLGSNGAGTVWVTVPDRADLRGTGGMDTLTDTNAAGKKFYQVGVEAPPY